MAEKTHQPFQDSWWFQYEDHHMKNNGKCTTNNTSSIGEESTVSNGSSDTATDDDASSSASSHFRSSYDMSEIMRQLPIKRGLSKFYQGKSESFTSVLRVRDLAKRENGCSRKNMRAAGLHSYKSYTLPKHVIAKKLSRPSPFSSNRH